MADVSDIVGQLTQNPSFLNWLRGKAQGRGVPTWTNRENAGRYGGYPGWKPGMPRAPGNSPSDIMRRLGGTYSPQGNMPVPQGGTPPSGPPPGGVPGVGGSLTPPGAPTSPAGFLNATGALAAPMAGLASTRDVGWPARTQGADPSTVFQKLIQQQRPQGGAAAMPIPNASATPPPAQPIPPATGGMTPTPVSNAPMGGSPSAQGSSAPPPPVWNNPQPLPNATLNTPFNAGGNTPMPRPRPQQPVPMPMPRPMPASAPMPRPRPQQSMPHVQQPMPVKAPSLSNSITGGPMDPNLSSLLKAIFGNPTVRDTQTPNVR